MEKTHFIAKPGEQTVILTRLYHSPRVRLFKAFTDPALIPQWWGPSRMTIRVEALEVRKGGVWRFVHRDAGGREFAFHGVYHEVAPPSRLVYTFEFEGTPGHVSLETVEFENRGGKTRLTETSISQSVEDRDGMLASGMEEGASESMDRLADLLEKIK